MARPNDLHVYLLDIEAPAGRRLFYAEAPEAEGVAEPEPHGFRGRAVRVYRKIAAGCTNAPGFVARIGRRSWDFVREHMHPDERLLAQLRAARSIEFHHPATTEPDEVLAAWSKFLGRAFWRHMAWFLGNALISPLTLLLMPLPGPNLLGYWFVYRAVHHWLILVGLRRVRRGLVSARFRPRDDLSSSSLPAHLDPAEVSGFLKRHGVAPRSRERLCAGSSCHFSGL